MKFFIRENRTFLEFTNLIYNVVFTPECPCYCHEHPLGGRHGLGANSYNQGQRRETKIDTETVLCEILIYVMSS